MAARRAALLVLPLACLACGGLFSSRTRLEELRRERDLLHARLEAAAAKDPLVSRVLADEGQVVVAVRADFVEDVFEEVARRYLKRVVLDLTQLTAKAEGKVRKPTFLGTMIVGHWRAEFRFDQLRGVIHGRAPSVHAAGRNEVRVALPVALDQTAGTVTVRFLWSSAGIAKALCRDFELVRTVDGSVLPARYAVEGAFRLSAAGDTVTAVPEFPRHAYSLRVDLTPESWQDVRAALETQNSLLKCGIPLHPDEVVESLRRLAARGIEVKLPDSLFRPIRFPAGTQSSVVIGDKTVELSAKSMALRLEKGTFWSSASVHALQRPKR